MADLDAIEAKVAELLADRLQLEVPSRDTDLFQAGLLDSLAFVDLVVALEQTFGLRVSPDNLDVETFRSIDRIARFVCNRQEECGRADAGASGSARVPEQDGPAAIAGSASRSRE